ncbi:hypothetical protein TL5118_00979 [Thalassovita autumnalis]|uniref:Uncharacterized protein n=1 Tax=Thalassovita autumnalis TaxID=2072972 RepID=A0A0P1FQ10_9RHOB|nr:hypothetical protein TL5118_00979 [Thalassovita autumnalis]CUH70254.1 hypothetical protein TL5120_00027 [Thalassovita autumnalis]
MLDCLEADIGASAAFGKVDSSLPFAATGSNGCCQSKADMTNLHFGRRKDLRCGSRQGLLYGQSSHPSSIDEHALLGKVQAPYAFG